MSVNCVAEAQAWLTGQAWVCPDIVRLKPESSPGRHFRQTYAVLNLAHPRA